MGSRFFSSAVVQVTGLEVVFKFGVGCAHVQVNLFASAQPGGGGGGGGGGKRTWLTHLRTTSGSYYRP